MIDTPGAAAVIEKRREFLAALSTPKTKPELVETLDSSRSTVDRAIRSLRDQRFVRQEGSQYTTTYAGDEALAAYDYFLERLEALLRAQPVLAETDGHLDIDPEILHGADVVEATQAMPERPLDETITHFEGTTRFRGTGPAVVPRYIEVMLDLVEAGAEVELVVTGAVRDALETAYDDGYESMSAADSLSLYVTDEPMGTAVWSAEHPEKTVSGLVVYAETGIQGTIINDTDAMNEWALEQYESYRAEASRID